MQKKRARAILPEIEELITREALITDKKREILADELIVEIKDKYPNEVAPAWETVIKRISKARNHAPSDKDKPWHLGTLEKYPIPSEAIPIIIAIQDSGKVFTSTRAVSIRQALWISRLWQSIKDLDLLRRIAWQYAFHERISEITGVDFNTREYDNLLSNPKQLVKRFETSTPTTNYADFKKSFDQVTLGVKYIGPALPFNFLIIRDNKVYAQFMLQGHAIEIEMPFPDPTALLEAAKKQKALKSIKKLTSNVTVIRFKETISLTFENKEFNEWLHNLFSGVKQNERPYSSTEQE